MGKEGDLSDLEGGTVVGVRWAALSISESLRYHSQHIKYLP